MQTQTSPQHTWFLPGLRISHVASDAARLELFEALNSSGRAEAFLYDAEAGTRSLKRAWKNLTDEAWVFDLRYGGPESSMTAQRGSPDAMGNSGLDRSAASDLCAVVVLTGFTGRAAFFHFALLPGFDPFWVPMGRDIVAWLFESNSMASLIGFTPACYRHVLAGLPQFGFVRQFAAPEACFIRRRNRYCDGVISLCTPKTFEEAV